MARYTRGGGRWAVLFVALALLAAACTNDSGTAAKPRSRQKSSVPVQPRLSGQQSEPPGTDAMAPQPSTTVNGQPLTGRELLQATRARFTRPLPTVVPATTVPGSTATTTPTTTPPTPPTTAPPDPGDGTEPPILPNEEFPTQELIARAYVADEITYSQYMLYRAYALFWDPRLPAQFDGTGSTGEDDFFTEATVNFGLLDADTQAKIAPFLERPASTQGYGCPLTDNGQPVSWIDSGAASIHFKVWACATNGAADDIDAALDVLDDVYPDMTAGMGLPLPDADGGDPRIDVYLLDTVPTRVRNGAPHAIDGATIAAAVADAPFVDPAASSYLMIGRARFGDRSGLRRTLIHQFFHSLEYAHNYAIKTVDPTKEPWFFEASAAWAEAEFFPAGSAGVHKNYFTDGFRQAPDLPLEIPFSPSGPTTDHLHPYWAYLWPFFMQQEAGGDPAAVFDTWDSLEGADDWNAFHAAIDAELPFATSFRDFAVRNLNLDLGPAFEPHYGALDPNFPVDVGPPLTAELDLTAPGTTRVHLGGDDPIGLSPLSAQYDHVAVTDKQATVLTLDFADILTAVDITVLTQSATDGTWTRHDLVNGDKLEMPFNGHDGPVSQAYVIIDNPQREPDWAKRGGGVVMGSYTVTTAR